MGWSYADYGETVVRTQQLNMFHDNKFNHQGTTEEAAKDIASFVQIFFEHFTDFRGRAFHLAGESYGVCIVVFPIVLQLKYESRDAIFLCLLEKSGIKTRDLRPLA